MIGIYKITNKINNHCYIGQSKNIEERWKHHRNFPLKNSKYPLYLAFVKYGIDNFSFEVLEECSIDELDDKEIKYINQYDSYNNGYNQTKGGSGSNGNIIKVSNDELYEIYDLLLNTNISQKEIAIRFNIGEDTVSEINNGKTRNFEGFSYPLRNNKKEKNFCIDCGVELRYKSKRCSACNKIASRITERPTREELKNDIYTFSFSELGRKYNVSDNTIRKWCIGYNLPSKKTIINTMTEIEWQKI